MKIVGEEVDMDFYELANWLSFFYLYSFIGWGWECIFVSVRKRKWINRGFLRGPVLPIYGLGAVTILIVTSPVKDNFFMVFAMGMLGATLLEYVTGSLMEHIFHVRYWDYSKQPWNVNGYICLGCSLGWGLFSVLLINIIHNPIGRIISEISKKCIGIFVLIVTAIFIVDVVLSVNEAIDLKKMILHEAEKNRKLQYIQQRKEEIIKLWEENSEKQRERNIHWKLELEEEKERLERELVLLKASTKERASTLRHASQIIKRNPGLQAPQYEKVMKNIRNLLNK